MSTLLALGVGFNKDLTGRENVMLGGLAAGLARAEIAEKYDAVTEFAEIGDFVDLPMRTYSSGMYGRLAFSVAVNMDPTYCSSTKRSPSATRASSGSLSTGCASFAPSRHDLHRQPRPQRSAQALHRDHLAARGKIAMRDDPDSVIDEYKRFLNIGRAPSRSRTSDMRTRVRRVLKPAKRIVRGRHFRRDEQGSDPPVLHHHRRAARGHDVALRLPRTPPGRGLSDRGR